MAGVPDPDQHQINYFLAPGRSVHHSETHAEVAGKTCRQTQQNLLKRGKESQNVFHIKYEILAIYLAYTVVEN